MPIKRPKPFFKPKLVAISVLEIPIIGCASNALRAIKESTEAAKWIVANAEDETDSRSEALMAMLQEQLFAALMDISELNTEELDPQARFDWLSEGGKRIAGLISASTRLKEYQNKIRAKTQAAADEVAQAIKKGGLSDDTAEQIRKQILGIAS